MKNNYKIRVGGPVISDEKIEKHRDFESVLTRYNSITEPLTKKPLYKNPRTFLGLVLVLVMGVLVFKAVKEEQPGKYVETENGIEFVETPMVDPPLAGLTVAPMNYTLDAAQSKTLDLGNGLKLTVPDGAFGPGISGQVRLDIRMITDPASRLTAGIPSRHDEKGLQESVLLLEIKAIQNNVEIPLVAGKTLKLEWENGIEKVAGESLFYLDHQTRKWISVANSIQYESRQVEVGKLKDYPKSDGFQVMEMDENTQMVDSGYAPPKPGQKQQDLARQGKTETLLIRTFTLDKMGIWDFAAPKAFDEKRVAKVFFKDESGKPLEFTTVYVLTENVNAVYAAWNSVHDTSFELVFDGKKMNMAVGVTPEGRLAIMGTAQFSLLEENKVNDAKMEVYPNDITSMEQLRELLQFPLAK